MIEVGKRVMELFDGKVSIYFPQIQTLNGNWCSISGGEGKELAFNDLKTANEFLAKMPKQTYQIHEFVEPAVDAATLKPVGDA